MRLLKLGMQGSDVMEIQATLRKLGYHIPVDGMFSEDTKEAVKKFQSLFGLYPDGIIGRKTYRILYQYLVGFDVYVVREYDTITSIAKRYHTSPQLIRIANPSIARYGLRYGLRIVIPYDFEVVDTTINYDYDVLEHDLTALKARYPFVELGVMGKSVLGRNLYYVKMGSGPHKVFYNAAHHSLEWITSVVMMKFIENFLESYAFDKNMSGYRPRVIWKQSTIYIVPMVNPDGIDLVLNGLKKTNPLYNELLAWNKGSDDFSKTWQANAHGVDLNHNYNAGWEEAKSIEVSYGVDGPGPTRYVGEAPESEPEVKANVAFTRHHNFSLVLAYHSQGELIYWDYQNLASAEAKRIGRVFSYISGYYLDETSGIASLSGYKDWFILEFRRPGYTIEVGKGKNPLPISQFDQIYQANSGILLEAATIGM